MNNEPMDSEDGRPPEAVLAAFGANASRTRCRRR
jgi:hypothetical protein